MKIGETSIDKYGVAPSEQQMLKFQPRDTFMNIEPTFPVDHALFYGLF